MPHYEITGARMQARSGLCVSGLSRANDFWWPRAWVTIAGTDRTASVRRGLSITERNGDIGATCSFVIDGAVVPAKGAEVIIGVGSADNRYFGGHVVARRLQYLGNMDSLSEYQIECAGYAWLLSFRLVSGYRPQETADARIAWLLSTYAPDFALPFVQTGMGNVEPRTYDLTQTVAQVLTDVLGEVGGWWYVDAYKHLYAGTGTGIIPGTDPTAIAAFAQLHALAIDETYGQLGTRIYASGVSTTTSEAFSAGDVVTSIIIEDGLALAGQTVVPTTPTNYPVTGSVLVGGNLLTITGVNFNDPGWSIAVTSQAITDPIPVGAPVTAVGSSEDAAAQAAVASAIGSGDGVREAPLRKDGATFDALGALAAAELAVVKDGETAVRYRTREQHHRAGRTVAFALAPLTADLTIQSVTISDLEGPKLLARWPMCDVTAGETYRNFTDVMRRRMLR